MKYTYKDAKELINLFEAIGGEYWESIVASILRQVVEESGKEMADRLIQNSNLEAHGWREEKCHPLPLFRIGQYDVPLELR